MDTVRFEQFYELKKYVGILLFNKYGRKPVFFEHGPASERRRGGSCVDHAHLHAIPVDIKTPLSMVSKNLSGGKIDDIHAVVEYAKAGKPYFFLEYPGEEMYLYDASALPCQYGRQIFASVLGVLENWDWQRYPFFKKMIETQCQLRNQIEKEREK